MTTPIIINETEAMVVAIVATEAFSSLDTSSMPPELLRGVLLLYEAMVRRIEPQLPKDTDMAHVRDAITKVKALAISVRSRYDLPPLQ